MMQTVRYPNLSELIKYHPYHIDTFANFADVTTELLQAALNGQEELADKELWEIMKYTGIPFSVLKCPQIIMLDRNRIKHRRMIDKMMAELADIWAEQKGGSKEANSFMKYSRTEVVNLELAFLDNRASYARYLGVKERINQTLLFIQNEKRKPRELKRRQQDDISN